MKLTKLAVLSLSILCLFGVACMVGTSSSSTASGIRINNQEIHCETSLECPSLKAVWMEGTIYNDTADTLKSVEITVEWFYSEDRFSGSLMHSHHGYVYDLAPGATGEFKIPKRPWCNPVDELYTRTTITAVEKY